MPSLCPFLRLCRDYAVIMPPPQRSEVRELQPRLPCRKFPKTARVARWRNVVQCSVAGGRLRNDLTRNEYILRAIEFVNGFGRISYLITDLFPSEKTRSGPFVCPSAFVLKFVEFVRVTRRIPGWITDLFPSEKPYML